MDQAGAAIAIICAVAIVALSPFVARGRRRGAPYADLGALGLVVAALMLLGAFIAQLAGAAGLDTGKFLIGMGVGVAVGLTLGCVVLLVVYRRVVAPGG
jgi:hypothetical protein